MATVSVGANGIRPDFPDKCLIKPRTYAAAINAGQPVYLTTVGKVDLVAANTSGKHQFLGIAMETRGAGETGWVMEDGYIWGFDLSSQAYDAVIFASDTAGTLQDTAGTNAVPVGRVDCLNDNAKTKILRVINRPAAAFA